MEVEAECNNGACQCLCPRRESQQVSAPLINALTWANGSFTYSPGAFQTAASVQVPRASDSACEPLKRSTSAPYSPLGLLDVSHIGFQRQIFCSLSLYCRPQGLRCLMQHRNSSLFRVKLQICKIPPNCGHRGKCGFFFVRPHLCHS